MIGYKGSKFKFLNKCSVNQITMFEYDIFDVSVFVLLHHYHMYTVQILKPCLLTLCDHSCMD